MPKKLEDVAGRLGEAQLIEMLDTLKNVVEMSTRAPEEWACVMLAFGINQIHDEGYPREQVEVAARTIIDEEWSTPNTSVRAFLGGRRG